jgi:hypothetical protein
MLGDRIGLSGLIESAAIATVDSLGAFLAARLAACLAVARLAGPLAALSLAPERAWWRGCRLGPSGA